MKKTFRPRLRLFENAPGQRHIEASDHYLYAAPEPRFRLALVGTGTMGQEHMRVARLLGAATVHGIFDTRSHSADVAAQQHRQASGTAPRVYSTLQELCADPEPDAVFICTPNHTHLAVLREVISTGKPIFLEKPMTTNLADAARLVELAARYPAPVQLGLQYRYKAPYAEARVEALERRSLGAIRTISMSEYRPPFLDKVGQWNKFTANTGGTLVEKCCHYFDLMQQFAAAPLRRVMASGGQAVNFLDFEYRGQAADISDHAFVILEYENGVRGSFALNMFSPHFYEELVLCGDQGRLLASERVDVLRGDGAESQLRIELPEPGVSRDVSLGYPRAIEQSGHSGATYMEHLAFLELLQGGDGGAATPLDGLWSLITAAAAQESMDSGQVVSIGEFIAGQSGLAEALERAQRWKST